MTEFSLSTWLNELGLPQYLETFEDNAIYADCLPSLSNEDLLELGIQPLGHRKKLLGAIAQLTQPAKQVETTGEMAGEMGALSGLCSEWPTPVAVPLREYLTEEHPTLKLWAACDTVEMLLRLLVIVGLAKAREPQGGLPEALRRQVGQMLETPTLGAWMHMAGLLWREEEFATTRFLAGPLRSLLYADPPPGSPENSFLKLRNLLAHGGGLPRAEAVRLFQHWQAPLEQVLREAGFLSSWAFLFEHSGGVWKILRGTGEPVTVEPPLLPQPADEEPGALWFRDAGGMLSLWPLSLFSPPCVMEGGRKGPLDQPVPQIYTRRESMRLAYLPLGLEGMAVSESTANALQRFEAWFQLPVAEKPSGFQVRDFQRDLQKDAAQMVGRGPELERIQQELAAREQGVFWLSGVAGMGKSFLVAKLATELEPTLLEGHLLLTYRFRVSDRQRCGRGAFAQFVIERLLHAGALMDSFQDQAEQKAEKRLSAALSALRRDRHLLLILDGLDEVSRGDPEFAEEIPLAIRMPRLRWLCAGRPEGGLPEVLRRLGAVPLFPEGLPPMRETDVRGMILEKIGPLRKKLLQNDQEKGLDIINPFVAEVARRAEGLPLYVKYVIGDVLSGKYRVLDGQEDLPDSLHAYHEELLRRLGIGDLQMILTPLAAILASAYEPLTREQMHVLFLDWGLVQAGGGQELLEKGLAAIASLLREEPTPEGDRGCTLFHPSLRDHILQSPLMHQSVSGSRKVLAGFASVASFPPCLERYLIRRGVPHLLDAGRDEAARAFLLELDRLQRMYDLEVDWTDIYKWWMRLGGEPAAMLYEERVGQRLQAQESEDAIKTCGCALSLAMDAVWLKLGEKLATRLLKTREHILGPEHPDTLSSLNNLGVLLSDKGDYDGAEACYRRALAGREKALGPEHPDTLSSIGNLGVLLWETGNYEGAEEYYRRALTGQNKVLGPDHPDTLSSLNNLGVLLKKKGDYEEAEAYYRLVLDARENALGPEHPDTLSSLNNLGVLLKDKGDYDGAEVYYRQALAGREKALGPEHPDTLSSLNNLGFLLKNKGDHEGAEAYYRRALAGMERTLGPEHAYTLSILNNFGDLLVNKGDYDGAEVYYRQALEGRFRALGPDHPDTLDSVYNLANLSKKKGNLAEAEALHRQALAGREKALGPDHFSTLSSLNNLAVLLKKKGESAEAELLYRRVLSGREKRLGPDHPQTLNSANNLAILLSETDRFSEAEPLYRRIFESRQKALGPDHASTLSSLYSLAQTLEKMGNLDEALPLFERELHACREANGEEDSGTQHSAWNLSRLFLENGDLAKSRAILDVFYPLHPDFFRDNLAAVTCLEGRLEEAKALLEEELEGAEDPVRLTEAWLTDPDFKALDAWLLDKRRSLS